MNNTLLLSILFGSLHLTLSNVTYRITPTTETKCFGQDCYTLSEIAINTEMYFVTNTTLVFLPGIHMLNNTVVLLEDLQSLTFTGNSSSVPSNSEILCTGDSALIFRNVLSVEIKSLVFNSCGSSSVPIAYSHILKNSGYILPTITLIDVPNAGLQECIMAHGYQALHFHESNAISECNHFLNNTGRHGAAIVMIDSHVVFSEDNNFLANTATELGGAIYSTSSNATFKGSVTFHENRALKGGGIYGIYSKFVFGPSSNATSFKVRETQQNMVNSSKLLKRSDVPNKVQRGIFTFIGNSANVGGALYCISYSTIIIDGVALLENNSVVETVIADTGIGGAVVLFGSSWTSTVFLGFAGNSAIYGGAVHLQFSGWKCEGEVVFYNNSAGKSSTYLVPHTYGNGGALYASESLLHFSGNTNFVQNTGVRGGGAIYATSSELQFTTKTTFHKNAAVGIVFAIFPKTNSIITTGEGGGILAGDHSYVSLHGDIAFTQNSAYDIGGAITMDKATLNIIGNSTFETNSAGSSGGAIYALLANITMDGFKTAFRDNTANDGGAINSAFGRLEITGRTCRFSNNRASRGGGALRTVHGLLSVTVEKSYFVGNTAAIYGGTLTTIHSTEVAIDGENTFIRNTAIFGGAIAMVQGSLLVTGKLTKFLENDANYGGAAYFDKTLVTINGTHTQFEANIVNQAESEGYGGALYSSGSAITFAGSVAFTNNSATSGGAIVVTQYDQKKAIYFSPNSHVLFHANYATKHGGGIMVEDSPLSYCEAELRLTRDLKQTCFFKVDATDCDSYQLFYSNTKPIQPSVLENNIYIEFVDNRADSGGYMLYGGVIDECKMCFGDHPYLRSVATGVEALAALTRLSKEQVSVNTLDVTSDPIQVCICNGFGANCSIGSIHISVHPGQTLTVPLMTVGQLEGRVPGIVHATFNNTQYAHLDSLENAQRTNISCTPLKYTLYLQFIPVKVLQLNLFPEGPCGELGHQLVIEIIVLPCPDGFVFSQPQEACVCDKRLQKHTNSCDINSGTITRSSNFWVGYDRQSPGLILHSHCPFDYCTLEIVSFTLNSTDQQCAHGRSGTLCGACKSGLSLNLGSSQCSSCSNTFVLLLLPFAAAGFLLVIFLFTCKLTVSAGTTSGLIFYANIIAVNQSVFFPPGETNILTVFIAWLNLDLGIETCFFDGMDAYTRTWLQFVFPLYIWSLVGLISLASHYSITVARIIGPTNPVTILATLFLLSYTKLLRTIIATFSFTTLDYPDDQKVPAWAYDGNIRFCEGKHAALFVAGLLAFLFVFLPYTLLLLCGQFIIARSNFRVMSWANRRTCKAFLDAYYAPYKNIYRYWTGLLLVIRCFLFIISAVADINTPKDPSINLLMLAVTCIALTVWIWNTGSMYKKWYCNVLESSFILNLAILAAASYQVKVEGGNKQAVVYTSVGVAFVTFMVIIAHHMIERVIDTRIWKHSIKPALIQLKDRAYQLEETEAPIQLVTQPVAPPPKVTTTFVELREPLLDT